MNTRFGVKTLKITLKTRVNINVATTNNDRVINDAITVSLLIKYVENESSMTNPEKRKLHDLLQGQASATSETDQTFVYETGVKAHDFSRGMKRRTL